MWVVVFLLLGAAAAQCSAAQTVLCGRELAKARAMYCSEYKINPFPVDAVDSSFSPLAIEDSEFLRSIPERFIFRARRFARARLSPGDLVEACCLKPCHVSELLNYC
ncbi:bombyxin A-1 homolog [Leguminivora glycinivorella]|uniref:bombyxin A-1 homolog n=1 Tax=Leguminivora glycinivorella TaxID=1035111 RepID=UPI00200DC830|nr:bombyxin A-1 homolog [Leguminivora glycinivorella]